MVAKSDAPVKLELFDRLMRWPDLFHLPMSGWPFEMAAPIRVDEFRENGTLVVRADMPGIDPDKDVEVTITDHTLHIAAEHHEEEKVEGKSFYRKELRYGSFRRDLPLPVECSEEDVKATYLDGILEIRVPVAEERKEKVTKIAVTKKR
jgi:HSP20 family protein